MGHGAYSCSSSSSRSIDSGYHYKSTAEVFKEKTINLAMNPYGIKIRESRDSKEHPNSSAIILALDVTGSMGSIPHYLVKQGLCDVMGNIMKDGLKDPQVLFIGIGDHECDNAPLQVSQFESSDELLDHWLTKLYLEGGGGGNDGESYLLSWYFASKHTSIDCFEKRKQKGVLITIGDEPALRQLPKVELGKIMAEGEHNTYSASDLLGKAEETYHVYHIHMKEGSNGERQEVIDGWKQLIKDNLRIAERKEEVSQIIAEIIKKHQPKTTVVSDTKKEDIIL